MSENNMVSISQEDKIDILVADYEQKLNDLFEQEKINLQNAKAKAITLREELFQVAYDEIKDSLDSHNTINGYKWKINNVHTRETKNGDVTVAEVSLSFDIKFPGLTQISFYEDSRRNASIEGGGSLTIILNTVDSKNQEIKDNQTHMEEIRSKIDKINASVRTISQKTRQLKATLIKQRIGDSNYQSILENPEVADILKIEY